MSIILFFCILFVLVLVHEWGHFVTAKFFKMPVEEFGFGFPPRAMKLFKRGETTFTLNWLPLGGFVKITGEDLTNETNNTNPKLFSNQPWYAQLIVLLAGVTMNFILAWVLITGSYMSGAPTTISDIPQEKQAYVSPELTVLQVISNSSGEHAGIIAGDRILKACRQESCPISITSTRDELIQFIRNGAQEPVVFTIQHGGTTKDITVTPKIENNIPVVGLAVEQIVIEKLSFFKAMSEGLQTTATMSLLIVKTFITLIRDAFLGVADVKNLTGPIGLVSAVGSAYSIGIGYLVSLAALISLNLAVINLVPFPALDGGRILFVIIEAITKRKIPAHVAGIINSIGFFLLIGLMVFISYHDIVRIIK